MLQKVAGFPSIQSLSNLKVHFLMIACLVLPDQKSFAKKPELWYGDHEIDWNFLRHSALQDAADPRAGVVPLRSDWLLDVVVDDTFFLTP